VAGETCAEDGFCRPDWQRQAICDNDEDCLTGHVCLDGACRTPCLSGNATECMEADHQLTVCADDNLCYKSNEDMPECFAGSDCTSTQSCIDAICR